MVKNDQDIRHISKEPGRRIWKLLVEGKPVFSKGLWNHRHDEQKVQ